MPMLDDSAQGIVEDPWSCLYRSGVRLDDFHKAQTQSSVSFRAQLAVKRGFDILLSSLLLLLLSPLLLVPALLVRATSKGPFLFRQARWGRGDRQFLCYKIRSMYVAGDPRAPSLSPSMISADGKILKQEIASRVTPVGRWLRRTSIDELPQLINVFVGDMSLVGPRPLMVEMLTPFEDARAVRSAVRPGITGLWQVRNRQNNMHVSQMIVDDTEYIRRFSLKLDLEILCATPVQVFKGIGAL